MYNGMRGDCQMRPQSWLNCWRLNNTRTTWNGFLFSMWPDKSTDTLNQIDTIQSNTWGENSRNPSDDGRGSGGMTEEADWCRAYIHHKLLAHRSNFFAESGGEHHNLLLVRCHSEYLLYISSHIWNQNSSAINSIIHINITNLFPQSSSKETKESGEAFIKPVDCKCVTCIIMFPPGWLFLHDGDTLI